MNITKNYRALVVVGCFALATTALQGQVYTTVKDAVFALRAIQQLPDGGTVTVRITNKDILAALNASGGFHFGPGASLLMQSVNGALPTFVVREITAGQTNTTDVSNFLVLTEPDYAVHTPGNMLNWGIWNFTLIGPPGTDFTLWGLTTLYTGKIPTGQGGDLSRTVHLTSNVFGPGHMTNAPAQLSGTISAAHGRIN